MPGELTSNRYFRDFAQLERTIRVPNTPRIRDECVGKYMQPILANNETFDAVLFVAQDAVIVFQMTVGMDHDIKANGLKSLYDHLPENVCKVYFVWVVPTEVGKHYQKAKTVDDEDTLAASPESESNGKRKRQRTSKPASAIDRGCWGSVFTNSLEVAKKQLQGIHTRTGGKTPDLIDRVVERVLLVFENRIGRDRKVRADVRRAMTDIVNGAKEPLLAALRNLR